MAQLSADTHPKIEAMQINRWRQATPTQKMNLLADLNRASRQLALQGLKTRYPQANNSFLHRKLADLILGTDLAQKVYGTPSDEK
ncbi:MAG: hypothetical protein OHK0052_11630 [Anaerolineales bacterium]